MQAWSALDAVGPLGSVARRVTRRSSAARTRSRCLRLAANRVARERSPQLVTVFGQAGVGKSRLVSEFVAELEGARVLVGRCVPYGDGITYLPLAEVAGALAGIREDEPTDVALTKLEESVARAVPPDQQAAIVQAVGWTMGLSLPERSAGIGIGGEVRQALHDAWTKYLAALGRQELVVLVVEDIHWASEPLLDLLDDVLAGLEDTAVLIVCPSRPELLDARPSWGTGRLDASSLTLAPLAPAEAESLLGALLDSDAIPDEVASRILGAGRGQSRSSSRRCSRCSSSRARSRSGTAAGSRPTVWRSTSVPDSIHGVIAARIDLLESREREALRRCSVMGRVFWPSAVGVDDDLVASLGRRAIVSEQLESAFSGRREFAFKHALTHEVAYTTLPRYERGDAAPAGRASGSQTPSPTARPRPPSSSRSTTTRRSTAGEDDEELRQSRVPGCSDGRRRGDPPRGVLVGGTAARAVRWSSRDRSRRAITRARGRCSGRHPPVAVRACAAHG